MIVGVHFGGCSNLSCSKVLTTVIRGRREFFTFCLLPFISPLNHKDLSPIKKVSDSWLSLFSKPLKEERCVGRKSYVILTVFCTAKVVIPWKITLYFLGRTNLENNFLDCSWKFLLSRPSGLSTSLSTVFNLIFEAPVVWCCWFALSLIHFYTSTLLLSLSVSHDSFSECFSRLEGTSYNYP